MKKTISPTLRLYKISKEFYGKTEARHFVENTISYILFAMEEAQDLDEKKFEQLLNDEVEWFESLPKKKRKKKAA